MSNTQISAISKQLTVGDKVLIPKLGAMKITIDGQDYFICKENDILGIVKN